MSSSDSKKEDWMNAKWRPMMGWMYMLVCTMDFVVFPILWSLIQSVSHGNVSSQWSPVTLQGAGLFHMAMGAIMGVAAFGRTQEKLAGVSNGGSGYNSPTPQGFGTSNTFTPTSPANSNNYSNPPTPIFGNSPVPTGPSPAFGPNPTGPAQSFPEK